MNWDFIVGIIVIISLILIVWAKISHQTVAEVIGDIKDIIRGGTEEIQDRTEEVIMYE